MLCNRIKQFREYNEFDAQLVADLVGVSKEEYLDFESGRVTPDIDIVMKLTRLYKTTREEFYGYTPTLSLQSDIPTFDDDDDVPDSLLRLSQLSWEEIQIVMKYRESIDKETFFKAVDELSKK